MSHQLITQHRSNVLKFILSKVKNPQLAEDLTQDVFLRLMEKMKDSHSIDNMHAYLYTMARNQVFDYWKKAARDIEVRKSYWLEIQTNHIVRTFPLIQQDQSVIYQYIMEQFTDQQKKVFLLNRQEGLSYKEIASQLELSKSTVKNHMVAALKIIRKYMDEHSEKFIFIGGFCLVFPWQ